MVRLHLKESYNGAMLVQGLGISEYSVYRWAKLYRKNGEQALRPNSKRAASGSSIPKTVQDKIVVTATAWNVAAKQWLVQNGKIRIVRAGKVLPNFYPIWAHN